MSERLAINGGAPVRSTPYPEWPQHDEREIQAVTEVVRSGEWGGFPEPGRNAGRFEEAFAAYQGAAHGILMSNGTVTMEVALKALGIGWGDEVIVPALTFAATAYAAIAAGALPVIVDVTPDTWCIDPDLVEAAITPRTRAIMPVHLGHQMADMDRIMDIANSHGLAVVEDCAHAHGQQWRGPRRRLLRRVRLVQPSILEDPHRRRGRHAPHERRRPRPPRALADRLRPREGRGREGVHVRRELPPRRAPCRAPGRRDGAVPRAAARASREREAVREPGGPGAGGARDAADERITRWSFYNYILAIDPESFGGRTNEIVCAAMEAEGIPAEVQYPSMSRYDLFQPSLSRLPVAVEFADRLDPARMSFPVAEAAGLRESVYFMENVFRDGSTGLEDAVEALAKVQRQAHQLPPG